MHRQTAEERFYAYMAVAAPSQRLVITYAKNHDGDALLPSSLVAAVKHILPRHKDGVAESSHRLVSESTADAFAAFSEQYREPSVLTASYQEVFQALPAYADRLNAIQRLEQPFAFRQPEAARQLFGEHLSLSSSQIETYHQCRFAYFCKYALKAKPRKKAEINAAEAGTLAHYIMQTLLPRYCEGELHAITRARITEDVTAAVQQYVADCMGGIDNKEPRFMALVARITRLCDFLMWRVVRELQQSRFTPVDYELPIGMRDNENGVAPWVITLPDGASVRVRGVVDRVDTYREGDTTYLRVLDYKTGHKQFDLGMVLEGINLQMLIYLFAICENGTSRYGNVVPAGVLYLPAKVPSLSDARDLTAEELETAQLSSMCTNGLLLDDVEVLRAMETEPGGVFIPTYLNKKGELSTGSFASLAQFGKIQQRIQTLLTAMVEHLHAGDISAVPTVMPDGSQLCRYCEYRDVCGREATDAVYEIAALSQQEALASLQDEPQEEVTTNE